MDAIGKVVTFPPVEHAAELSPMGVGIESMPMDAKGLTLKEAVVHLGRLAEEWEELLRNHEAMIHELHATKEELQRVLRESGTTKAEYEQLLNQRDEILGLLNGLLARYGKERVG